MHALRTFVVIMGLMILAGLALLVAIVAGRLAHRPAVAIPPPPVGSLTAPPLDLPAGARIEAITAGSDRLVMQVALPDGNRQLIILDLATGRQLGVIPLRTAP